MADEHTLPANNRSQSTQAIMTAALNDPEAARQNWRPFLPDFCEIVMEGCRQHDRTCLNIYAQAMKLVGAQVELAVNIWAQFGVTDASQAKAMIESAMRARDLDPETAWRLSEQFVQEYRREHGLPELVEAKAASDSSATVV